MAIRPQKLHDEALDDIASAPTIPVNPGGAPVNPSPAATEADAKMSKPKVPPNREGDKKALLIEARKYGEADGAGKKSHIRFAGVLVRGGASGVLVETGKSQDASELYDAFMNASEKEAAGFTDSEKKSRAAQLSKVRAFIRLGRKYEDTALEIFENAKDVHKALIASDDGDRVKFRSTYTGVYSIAVAQCKPERQGEPLTPAEMKELLLDHTVQKETTGVTILIQALNLIESAMRGRAPTANSGGRDPINHVGFPNIVDALRTIIGSNDMDALTERDTAIEELKAKKQAAAEKKAKELADKEAKAKEAAIQSELTDDELEEELEIDETEEEVE
jgi:uncharacterized protein YjhX (UPF0386 family)